MSSFKSPKFGQYGSKDRALQKSISYERTSLTSKEINVYRYLGISDNTPPNIKDIQDTILMENRDRVYDTNPVKINCWLEFLPESMFDLSRFGIINPLGNSTQVRIHTDSFAADGLGRYIVVGDLIEVPFWTQNNIKSFHEVTDIDKKTEFENFLVVVTMIPVKDSQQTSDLDSEIPSNEILIDNLGISIEADQDAVFEQGGIDPEPSLYIDRDYIDADYFDSDDAHTYSDEEARTDYDVRPDKSESFLDDPNNSPL